MPRRLLFALPLLLTLGCQPPAPPAVAPVAPTTPAPATGPTPDAVPPEAELARLKRGIADIEKVETALFTDVAKATVELNRAEKAMDAALNAADDPDPAKAVKAKATLETAVTVFKAKQANVDALRKQFEAVKKRRTELADAAAELEVALLLLDPKLGTEIDNKKLKKVRDMLDALKKKVDADEEKLKVKP